MKEPGSQALNPGMDSGVISVGKVSEVYAEPLRGVKIYPLSQASFHSYARCVHLDPMRDRISSRRPRAHSGISSSQREAAGT